MSHPTVPTATAPVSEWSLYADGPARIAYEASRGDYRMSAFEDRYALPGHTRFFFSVTARGFHTANVGTYVPADSIETAMRQAEHEAMLRSA